MLPTIITLIGTFSLIWFCLWLIYKFRIIVHIEKKQNNKILEKLIETKQVDPDKVIDYLKEMNQASNEEGYKLTETLSKISDKITDKLKRNKKKNMLLLKKKIS
jgi:ABC-type transporter Mla subunit MlaD